MDCEVHWIGCQLSEIAEKVGQPSGWEVTGIVVTGLAALGTLLVSIANLVLLLVQHRLKKQADARNAFIRRKTFTGILGQYCLVAVTSSFFGKDDESAAERKRRSMDAYAAIGATGDKTAGKLFTHIMTVTECIKPGDGESVLADVNNYIAASLKSWENDPEADLLLLPDSLVKRYKHAWGSAPTQ